MAIKRIWHGWTTPENSEKYQDLLHQEIFPGIEDKNIPGYQSIELFKKDLDTEVEFLTIMTFDSIQSVIDFKGKDYEKCYVPQAAQKLLKRWDELTTHYESIEKRSY